MDPTAADVRIALLGPLQVTAGGADCPINGAVRRSLLAVLALRAGEVLSTDLLSELVWDGAPPATAQSALRVHVSHLRQVLGDPGLIERVGVGYRLALSPEHIDITAFEQHARSGRAALAAADLEAAGQHLHAAKELWRGVPLADLGSGAAADIERLFTQRSELSVDLAEWQMHTQGASADTSDLSALTVERPFDERVWRLLITAQYWTGRQGDALATYQRAVQALDSELGIEPTQALRQLQLQILQHDPALNPPRAGDVELPTFATSFIGRAGEIETLTALLDQHRLVTLTGLGGVGKTRLAVAVAETVAEGYSHGVVFVSFEALEDAALVPSEVATALGIEATGADELAQVLDKRQLLLVLDNCEQVATGVADLASAMLASAPRVRLLATSRVPLNVLGESVWVTPMLDTSGDELSTPESVQLFLERARQAGPHAALPDDDDPHLREAVTLLGGIPLAIELAAAQCSVLTVTDVVEQLRQAMAPVAAERDRSGRHHSMEVTLTGTLEHLDPAARMLLGRLTVFRSPVGVEALQQVCADAEVPAGGISALLAELVQAAVVVADVTGERGRYWLLPPVRQSSPAVLARMGHAPTDLAGRHLEYFRSVAQQAAKALGGPEQTAALAGLDEAGADLRAALRYAVHADPAQGLPMAEALSVYWMRRRMHTEGRQWMRQLLEAGTDVEPEILGDALQAAGALAWDGGDKDAAQDLLRQAWQIRSELDDLPAKAFTLNSLAGLTADKGANESAYEMWTEAHALFVEADHQRGVGTTQINRGIVARKLGWLDEAVTHLEQALVTYRALGSTLMEAMALERLAVVHSARGEHRQAMVLIRSAQTIFDDHGSAEQQTRMLWQRALRHRDLREVDEARAHVQAAARSVVADELVHHWWVSGLIETAAALAAPTDPAHAAALLGAARTHREASGHGAAPTTVPDLDEVKKYLGEVLGGEHLTEEMAVGGARPAAGVIARIAGLRADPIDQPLTARIAAPPAHRPW